LDTATVIPGPARDASPASSCSPLRRASTSWTRGSAREAVDGRGRPGYPGWQAELRFGFGW